MTPLYAFEWNYDGVGNRTYQKYNNQETYYTYDSVNALTQKHRLGTGYTYFTYDSRGNCTKIQAPDGDIDLEYNYADLVTGIKHKNGESNYFYYDAQLIRYAMEDSNGLSYFTWDSNGLNLLAEQDSTGATTAKYTHGYTPIDGIGSMVGAVKSEAGGTYYQYPIYDHRGTVVRLVDANGDIVGDYSYNAWGVPLTEQETGASNRFRYQSNWIDLGDSDGELVLSPMRVYHAGNGRFLQKDRLGFIDGLNLYAAFGGNAVGTVAVLGSKVEENAIGMLKLFMGRVNPNATYA